MPRPVASVMAELVEDVGSLRLRVTVSALGDGLMLFLAWRVHRLARG